MTNATRTLAIIFAGTVALALATSWSWSDASSAAFQRALLPVDTSAVQAVQIDRADAPSVRLERGDTGWSVHPPDTSASFPASSDAINNLLTSLPSLQVSAVATRQAEKHARYGVDSTGTQITMLGADGESLGRLVVGRTRIQRPQQNQGQSRMQRMRRRQGTPITYVRAPDQPDVYSVEQSFRTLTSRTVEDWRDKTIWTVDRAAIQRVDFTFPGDSSFSMQRPAPGDTSSAVGPSTWVSAGDTLESGRVSSMLRRLASPEADGFATGQSPDDVGPPQYEIRLRLSDGSQRTLGLRPTPSGDAYLGTADGFPYVARLQQDTWDQSVLRGRTALLNAN